MKRLAENVCTSEVAILKLQDDFTSGRVSAAAARRAFLPLWDSFVIDCNRYNSVLDAWYKYDEMSYKEAKKKEIYFPGLVSRYYNWFMC